MRMSRTVSSWFVAIALAFGATTTGKTATGTDRGAGNWQMIALTGPTQFTVPPPGQVTGVEYQAELAAIRNGQSRLTPSQGRAIDY